MNIRKSPIVLIIITLCIAALAGCGGGGGGGDNPPSINSASVTLPSGFSFVGGPVVINANVVDDIGINQVQATVSRGNTHLAQLSLSRNSATTFSTVYLAPGNATTSAITYTVQITAKDTMNQSAAPKQVTFEVPSASGPPPPPPLL